MTPPGESSCFSISLRYKSSPAGGLNAGILPLECPSGCNLLALRGAASGKRRRLDDVEGKFVDDSEEDPKRRIRF